MAHPHETLWKDMQEKTADKFVALQAQGPAATAVAIMLVAQVHARVHEGDQPNVGQGYPVGIAREIPDYRFAMGKTIAGIDHPLHAHRLIQ